MFRDRTLLITGGTGSFGDAVKVTELARDLIRLAGLPEEAVDIVYTGLRPGEKLYEELYFDEEATIPRRTPN